MKFNQKNFKQLRQQACDKFYHELLDYELFLSKNIKEVIE